MLSRLLKNSFFSNLRCDAGMHRHFSNTQVFEKWSASRTCAATRRAEKGQDGLFQQPVRDNCGRRQRGFTYIAVLLLIALHGAVIAAAGTVWHIAQKREKERELLFAGDQFRRAIRSYAASGPGVAGQLPRSLDDLMRDPRLPGTKRHLRKIFVDPMTGKMEWGLVRTPDGSGIAGVYSLSEETPLKSANFAPDDKDFEGAATYADWKFLYRPIGAAPPPRPRAAAVPANREPTHGDA